MTLAKLTPPSHIWLRAHNRQAPATDNQRAPGVFMSSSKQYRAKAAEYDERSRNTGVLSEIVEYKNLGRRFTELADNEDWVERNFKKTLHVPGTTKMPVAMRKTSAISRKRCTCPGTTKMPVAMRKTSAFCAASEPR